MSRHLIIYSLVALPGHDLDDFEVKFAQDIMPAVDTRQTRGGRIAFQRFLRVEQRRYMWIIEVDGTLGGSWDDDHRKAALEQLTELAVICGETHQTVLAEHGDGAETARRTV